MRRNGEALSNGARVEDRGNAPVGRTRTAVTHPLLLACFGVLLVCMVGASLQERSPGMPLAPWLPWLPVIIGGLFLFIIGLAFRCYRWNDGTIEKWTVLGRTRIRWGDVVDCRGRENAYVLESTTGAVLRGDFGMVRRGQELARFIRAKLAGILEEKTDRVLEEGRAVFYRRHVGIRTPGVDYEGGRLIQGRGRRRHEIKLANLDSIEIIPEGNRHVIRGRVIQLKDRSSATLRIGLGVDDYDVLLGVIRRHAPNALWLDHGEGTPKEPRALKLYLEEARKRLKRENIPMGIVALPGLLMIWAVTYYLPEITRLFAPQVEPFEDWPSPQLVGISWAALALCIFSWWRIIRAWRRISRRLNVLEKGESAQKR